MLQPVIGPVHCWRNVVSLHALQIGVVSVAGCDWASSLVRKCSLFALTADSCCWLVRKRSLFALPADRCCSCLFSETTVAAPQQLSISWTCWWLLRALEPPAWETSTLGRCCRLGQTWLSLWTFSFHTHVWSFTVIQDSRNPPPLSFCVQCVEQCNQ